jgi:hypothetical protein
MAQHHKFLPHRCRLTCPSNRPHASRMYQSHLQLVIVASSAFLLGLFIAFSASSSGSVFSVGSEGGRALFRFQHDEWDVVFGDISIKELQRICTDAAAQADASKARADQALALAQESKEMIANSRFAVTELQQRIEAESQARESLAVHVSSQLQDLTDALNVCSL